MKLIKHKPMPQTGIKLEGKIYRCNKVSGILELPIRLEWCNPVDEVVTLKKKKVERDDYKV